MGSFILTSLLLLPIQIFFTYKIYTEDEASQAKYWNYESMYIVIVITLLVFFLLLWTIKIFIYLKELEIQLSNSE